MKKNVTISIVMLWLLHVTLSAQTAGAVVPSDSAKVNAKITIAAAANLASVADRLKAAFVAKYPKASVDFVFGASGALTTQIQNGGPFQLFLSADLDFPQKLFDSGLAASAPQVYARGTQILLSTKALDLKQGLAILTSPAISQFAMANPEIAPYGKAAQEALMKAGLWDTLKGKVVTAQSITQAVQFTLTATGIGLINKSALYTKDLALYSAKAGTNWYEVDPSWYAAIDQAFVVLKSAANNPTAQAFAAFLLGPEARAILKNTGYAVP